MTTRTLSPGSMTSTTRTDDDIRRSPARLFPLADDVSELTVVCRREDFAASTISRAVEDCDAHLINLNVTADPAPDGSADSIVIELRVNRRDPWPVARSLARYGYETADTRTAIGHSDVDPVALDRINDLLRRLDV